VIRREKESVEIFSPPLSSPSLLCLNLFSQVFLTYWQLGSDPEFHRTGVTSWPAGSHDKRWQKGRRAPRRTPKRTPRRAPKKPSLTHDRRAPRTKSRRVSRTRRRLPPPPPRVPICLHNLLSLSPSSLHKSKEVHVKVIRIRTEAERLEVTTRRKKEGTLQVFQTPWRRLGVPFSSLVQVQEQRQRKRFLSPNCLK
jgi:hypothetical protein